MGEWRRHAIYFAPERDHPLARFGAAWLGWDAEAGAEVAPPDGLPAWLAARRDAITTDPRRYGFHATLKAPFRLAEGKVDLLLDIDAGDVASSRPAGELRLAVAELGSFVALVPDGDSRAIDDLAAACVQALDHWRAPLSEAEVARRRAAGLDATEEAYLSRWGYPYVLDRFRFHMTLTGPIPVDERSAVRSELARRLAPVLDRPVPVASVCRFSEGEDGRFRLVRRFTLRRGPRTRAGRVPPGLAARPPDS